MKSARDGLAALPVAPRALQGLMGALALAVLPHLFFGAPQFALAALAALGLRAWLARQGRDRLPRTVVVALALLALTAVYLSYHRLTGRDPGVALLLLMTGLKALESRTLRDGMLAAFLGYFIIATGFFYSQSIPAALYLAVVVVAQTGALITLAQGAHGPPLSARLRLALLLLVQSLPMMAVLFVLFPRLPSPLAGLAQPGAALAGLSDRMTPGQFSRLALSRAPALRAIFAGPPPPAEELYWRGPVLWQYDGRSWRPGDVAGLPPGRYRPQDPALPYTLMLQPSGAPWVPALDLAGQAPPGTRLGAGHVLAADKPIDHVARYDLAAYPRYPLDANLPRAERRAALQLPPDAAPQARALAAQWRTTAPDAAAVVADALNYIRTQGFRYTLTPPPLTGDPVDDFLFRTRAGYCEYYASSFVVLMRAAGIPARVVTGYQGGEYNPLGHYVLVRQADAHAWAEVWLAGHGWMRVDPTAAVPPNRVDVNVTDALAGLPQPGLLPMGYAAPVLRRLGLLWDSANFYWNDWVLGYGAERQRAMLARLGLADWGASALILGMVGGLSALALLYGALYAWRGRSTPAPLEAAYARLLKRLARHGVTRLAHEGPGDFIARAARRLPGAAEELRALNALYVGARYGTAGPAQAAEEFRRRLAALRLGRPARKKAQRP